ncbi:fimbrial protein [Petrimonas sp.]|uniref:fimbrial tip adhesin FimD n=1 Tax=Petrimonas sp. TaxID=2023866 RepID=UPI003F50E039
MKNRLLNRILLLLLGVTVLYSCLNDEMANCDKLSDKSLSLKLVVSSPKIEGSQTRSGVLRATEAGDFDGDYNENKISKLDILFYVDEVCEWYPEQVTYDDATEKAVIPIPQNILPLLDGTKTYDIYVIANGPDRAVLENKTLTQLKNITLTGNFDITNVTAAQPNFVMDGAISKAVSISNPDLGSVDLQRTAAKIRIRLLKGPNLQTYLDATTGASPLVSVHNGNNSATLVKNNNPLPESFFTTVSDNKLINKLAPTPFIGITTQFPIYSYPNDWSSDRSKETYLTVKIPLNITGVPGGTAEYFFYKVPVNFQTPQGPLNEAEKIFYRLDRNHLYDVQVTINELGGTEEAPVEVTGNYVIKDWKTNEVYGNVTAQHYLVVSQQNITMVNTRDYEISYSSSKLPVTVSDITAKFTYVDGVSGQEITKDYYNPQTGDDATEFIAQRPQITVDAATGRIIIDSKIPVNNVPKDITFKVSNGMPSLDLIVKIQQLPVEFITYEMGTHSSQNTTGVLPGHLNNKSMYIATTLIPSSDVIIGYPPLDGNGYTVDSEEVRHMISPKFQLASQLGATVPMSRNSALTQCRDYTETTLLPNGVLETYDDWRLPTEAEIAMIDRLQHQSTSAVKSVMTGRYYWDSYSANGSYLMSNPSNLDATPTNANVRCVRDIKE